MLVKNRVLPALFEGIQKINSGGMIRLYVPPVAPGAEEAPDPGCRWGAATIYEVELADIKSTPPEDLANSLLPPAPELPPALFHRGASDEQIIRGVGMDHSPARPGATELGLQEPKTELAAFSARNHGRDQRRECTV